MSLYYGSTERSDAYTMPQTMSNVDAINSFFGKVYRWMAAGLIITALTAYLGASSRAFLTFFFSSSAPMFIVAIAEIGLVIALRSMLERISVATAAIMFIVYSILNGILCSSVLLVYTQSSVATTFFATAGMFGVMSMIGLFSKRDMTGIGGFLRMGLWGLIIAIVVNMFMRSSVVEYVSSIIGIFIFLGLTAYDTNKLKQIGAQLEGGEDSAMAGKLSIIGALSLYLDFVNIFLYLLQLFGKRK